MTCRAPRNKQARVKLICFTYESIVVEDLWSLLGREVRNVVIWVLFFVGGGWLPVLGLLKELEGLGEVEDSKVVFLQFKMHDSQVVEVVLGVIRETLLIGLVVLAEIISLLAMEAAGMHLGVVLLVKGKILD